jgi:uncharacterized protein
MIERPFHLQQLMTAVRRSPVTALLGPRQCAKTTLARQFAEGQKTIFFDLESQPDRQPLENPELVLGGIEGIAILDEIQEMPELFKALRVLVDRSSGKGRFVVLGSASPHIVKRVSETLAGRVEFVELSGFDLQETGSEFGDRLWLRGGFPRAFLADSDDDSGHPHRHLHGSAVPAVAREPRQTPGQGAQEYPVNEHITVYPLKHLDKLPERLTSIGA